MIMVAAALQPAAEKAGIKVPPNLDDYKREEFPHWWIFETLQLGRPMPTEWSHWTNAKIIASIPAEKLLSLPAKEIMLMGFR